MQDYVFIKLDKKFSKIPLSEIMYAEALKKYVRIVTAKRAYMVLSSMCAVEQILPPSQFCRIHRSYIISLNYATDFDNESVYLGNKMFPIGKQHKAALQQRVVILSSENRQETENLTQ